jgi:hypothetical protein
MSINQKKLNSLAIMQVEKMRSKRVNLSVLPRFLSPYFKTSQLRNSLFLQSKETKKTIRITFYETIGETFYFKITSKKINYSDMWLSATTNKELLTKIIKKYEFFS